MLAADGHVHLSAYQNSNGGIRQDLLIGILDGFFEIKIVAADDADDGDAVSEDLLGTVHKGRTIAERAVGEGDE